MISNMLRSVQRSMVLVTFYTLCRIKEEGVLITVYILC